MIKRFIYSITTTVFFMGLLSGCGGGGTAGTSLATNAPTSTPTSRSTSLKMVDDETFNALSEDDKIFVANKLYTTLYKGVDLETLKKEIGSGHFISDFRKKLNTEVNQPDLGNIDKDDYQIPDGKRFGGPLSEKFVSIFKEIASTLYYTKLSRTYFNEWMAYVLDQTILFSPGWEIESVHPFPELISSNYYRIEKEIAQDHPIKKIAYSHMTSKENWARFRSPEDNGREMLEIWLYDYNDQDVPLAAKALQNWKWVVKYEPVSDTARDYVYYFFNDTSNADEMNQENINILGTSVVTGSDFYKAIVNHENFIEGVTRRLVNLFFQTLSDEKRDAIIEEIVASNPVTFKDIFEQIIFSKTYLFESNRAKTYEEMFFGYAHKLGLTPTGDHLGWLVRNGLEIWQGGMEVSKQLPFTYKLGRSDEVPSDSDSVIRLHQNIRQLVFLNDGGQFGWNLNDITSRYDTSTAVSLFNGMFQDMVGRKMTEDEKSTLLAIATDAGIEDPSAHSGWNRLPLTLMVFDYFSRLSEIYIYRKLDTGDAS